MREGEGKVQSSPWTNHLLLSELALSLRFALVQVKLAARADKWWCWGLVVADTKSPNDQTETNRRGGAGGVYISFEDSETSELIGEALNLKGHNKLYGAFSSGVQIWKPFWLIQNWSWVGFNPPLFYLCLLRGSQLLYIVGRGCVWGGGGNP